MDPYDSDLEVKRLRVIAVVLYVIAMTVNIMACIPNYLMPKSLFDINDKYNYPLFVPPLWALVGIWCFIYFLAGIFVIYQALPKRFARSRNDKLVYDEGVCPFIFLMFCNAAGIICFIIDGNLPFWLSLFF